MKMWKFITDIVVLNPWLAIMLLLFVGSTMMFYLLNSFVGAVCYFCVALFWAKLEMDHKF